MSALSGPAIGITIVLLIAHCSRDVLAAILLHVAEALHEFQQLQTHCKGRQLISVAWIAQIAICNRGSAPHIDMPQTKSADPHHVRRWSPSTERERDSLRPFSQPGL